MILHSDQHAIVVINTRLQRICGLEPVAHTLTRLCLADQDLTKLEGLCLPNLRQLLLQNNRIQVLENLDGVPKLQKLWLSGNHIQVIENLQFCTDLRELWLQDNAIGAISGLDQLTNLHNLALAKNRIAHFEELSKLASLPNLCSLSLSDDHYGSNPITSESGYKIFVINQLKQVRILDGLEIQSKDQRFAEDEYMKHVLAFNDKIDFIQRNHDQELLRIDSRRNRNNTHADLLQEELMHAFRALEDVVTTGRKNMVDEHTRHQVVRAKYMTALQNKLQSLQQEYIAQLDIVAAQITSAMERQDALFDLLELRAMAEEEQATAVAQLQPFTSATFQHVADSTADFRYIASLFMGRESSSHRMTDAVDWKMLQLYKCHTTLQLVSPDEELPAKGSRTSASPPVFLAGPATSVHAFFTDNALPPTSWLASDPKVAATGQSGHCHVLVCQLDPAVQVHEVDGGTWDEQVIAHTERHPALWTKVHIRTRPHGHVDSFVFLPPAAPASSCPSTVGVIPQYYAVCAATPSSVDEAELRQLLQDAANPPSVIRGDDKATADALLHELHAKMKREVESYQRLLWNDLQPDQKRFPEDAQTLQQAVSKLQSHIQDEQDTQTSMLRQLNLQKQRRGPPQP
ncbi:hypothetical protein, variant [Aphanomyces invadans]|uniref:Protein phosphatase 1 regulatory subunit 7 n=1 Tax=Aphanomyces invadans TaxID=157072 RepID=A0A024UHH8_9STRA|nr:hypothetical protein, variant [Aphanomyces invadans]XP_008866507.1 hypothetical protein H310_04103 [Aphanomyces invadans]ETW05068.1 hypothetical protein H310_04103 [Aphanomyces invadans]ETW05069.1 hypothetical protein, variant [Aphanomyces invadans]|eukprot:XP_008866506.1 hypothetical protein, variant [Aphanomyces invadans]